ncbi:MAG: hypothetical protein QFF03_10110 [Pseudomonadota bacterium]|nr:hypothetical protein [Pseudomonadota bacterium]
MRPPDENQNGSTRPPFLSASRRPLGGEDNILARLEREARRGKTAAPWRKTWIAWCGLAALAIVALIATLASLARENITVHRPPLVIGAKPAAADMPAEHAVSAHDFTPPSAPAAAPASEPEHQGARADMAAQAPPLMLLRESAAAPIRTDAAPPPPAKARPAAVAARKSVAVKAARPAPLHPVVAPVLAQAAKPAAPRPPAAPPRPKKAVPAAPAEPALDSDVALLSAILMHASRHANERCGGKPCDAAPAAPKTTD